MREVWKELNTVFKHVADKQGDLSPQQLRDVLFRFANPFSFPLNMQSERKGAQMMTKSVAVAGSISSYPTGNSSR